MIRYKSINLFTFEDNLYEYLPFVRDDSGESLTDKSYFVPMSEAVKTALPAGVADQVYFDFPSGHDTGERVPFVRRKGLDLSEIAQSIRSDQESIESSIKSAREKKAQQDAFDKQMAALSAPTANTITDSSSGS